MIAQFRGGDNVFKFDIRMAKTLDNYSFHDFPISSFAIGMNRLDRVGVSSGVQNELCAYDFDKPFEQHNLAYKIVNGHKAVITKMNLSSSYLVTGGLDGDLRVSYFGLFSSQLKRTSSVVTLKSWINKYNIKYILKPK